jgi:prevent-host-death family protein
MLKMTKNTISASDFKAHCSEVIDRVSNGHGSIVITKRGKPVAKLVGVDDNEQKSLFGFAAGHVKVHGDIMAPIDVEWEAAK